MKKSVSELLKEFPNKSYQYNFSKYVNNKSKISVTCDVGHIFEMSILQLKKYGCPYCNGNKISKDEILNKCKKIHQNKYLYNKCEWSKLTDKVTILCPDHGEFKQQLKLHLKGHKCQKCSNRYKVESDEFNQFCKKVDDSITILSKYECSTKKVEFFCKKHGVFTKYKSQIVKNKYICDKCYKSKINFEEFKRKSIEKWGDRFDYSSSDYINMRTKILMFDKKKNCFFEQTPIKNLKNDYSYNKRNTIDFINKSLLTHGDKYKYDKSLYINSKDKIYIECPKHGPFLQIPNNHLRGAGCPKCNRFDLKQTDLYNYIKESYNGSIILNDRNVLEGKEIDIYLPDLNLAFEFNGLYWHSEVYKDKKYHINKTKECRSKGVRLLHIWEDDWIYKKDIVKSMILNQIKSTKNRIFARNCEVKEIVDNKIIKDFLNKNHIQGFVGSNIKIGLFYEQELVSVMTFGNLRRALGNINKMGSYELLRFCSKLNTSVIGGASKLLKYFINIYKPSEIISYSDISRSDGNLYKRIGFKYIGETSPNYYYIINGVRRHRYSFRKDQLVNSGFDSNKTESQIMNERGILKIFDCGMEKFKIIISD